MILRSLLIEATPYPEDAGQPSNLCLWCKPPAILQTLQGGKSRVWQRWFFFHQVSKKVKHRHRHRHRHRHTEHKDVSKWHRRSGVIGLMYMYTFKKHYHENKSKKSIKVHTLVKALQHCHGRTIRPWLVGWELQQDFMPWVLAAL